VYLIDGNNLLWAARAAAEDGVEIGEVGLCGLVGGYLAWLGERGRVVFDGTGPRDKSGLEVVVGVEVVFAGPGRDADGVIEREIASSTAARRLTVVSSDRRLRRAARARRAEAVKSEQFWGELQRQLGKRRAERAREPGAKRQGLSEAETERWVEFFGLQE